jgi:hypothetical protein
VDEDNREENSGQEATPPITEYFCRLPYSVFDSRESGELTPSMFLAMVWLFKWADWSSGSIEKMCAERLVWATEGEFEKRTFEEALQNLQKAGWIHSHHKQGSKRPYRVDICNYVALSGAQKNQILNPSEIKTWRSMQPKAPRGRRAESAQIGRADDREVNREVNGSPSATTMRDTTENNTRDSSETSSKTLASEPRFYTADLQKLIRENQQWLRMKQDEIQSGKRHGPLIDADPDTWREFKMQCKAIGVPWQEIDTAWREVIRPFQTAPPAPAPKPVRPQTSASSLTPKQVANFLAYARSIGWNHIDIKGHVQAKYKVRGVKNLSLAQFDELRRHVERISQRPN